MSSPEEAASHPAPPPAVVTNASTFNVDGTVTTTDDPEAAAPGTPATQHDVEIPEGNEFDQFDTPSVNADTFDTPRTVHRSSTF